MRPWLHRDGIAGCETFDFCSIPRWKVLSPYNTQGKLAVCLALCVLVLSPYNTQGKLVVCLALCVGVFMSLLHTAEAVITAMHLVTLLFLQVVFLSCYRAGLL